MVVMVIGCGGRGDDDELEADAESSAVTAGSTAEIATMSAWFGHSEGAAPAVSGEIAAAVISDATTAITDALAACATYDTDEATYLEVTFDCDELAGTLRGELDFETTPCGPAECPTAILWSLTAELTLGDGGVLDGGWLVTAPIDPDDARSFDGAVTVTSAGGATLATTSTATWQSGDDGCITLDGEAAVDDDALELAIDGLAACPGHCPSAGTIEVAARRGTLGWTYDGSDEVTVTSSGGHSVELMLGCTP